VCRCSIDFPQLPELLEQRAIAHILRTLDDKIELNRRMNETLEAMARALFKSWFVDFEPVRAKAEGRHPGLPKHLADLFPARLVSSEPGEIPEGWEEGTLAGFASLNPEAWSIDTRPTVINYVDLANTKWGKIEVVTTYAREDAPSRAQRVLRPGDTIVGTVRPGNGSYAHIAEDRLTGSTGFAVLRPAEGRVRRVRLPCGYRDGEHRRALALG
jgi:type I restriction enzyme S subunit